MVDFLCRWIIVITLTWAVQAPGAVIFPTNINPYPYYLVAVAIFKNEAAYVAEWLEYHHSVGVEKFFLYDNDSGDDPYSVLCSYIVSGLVNYTHWPGVRQQNSVYRSAIPRLRSVSFWVAFIDLDEFILPLSSPTIPPILRNLEDSGGLVIYWVVFGSGGQKNQTSGLVIERFVDHAPLDHLWSHIVKSIVNPRTVKKMGVHEAKYLQGPRQFSCDCHGTWFRESVRLDLRTPVHDCIRINHYWTKSFEEWARKRARGRAAEKGIKQISEYNQFGKWFGYNNTLMAKHVSVVKKRLAQRRGQPCKLSQQLVW
jgi:hypothetical protein